LSLDGITLGLWESHNGFDAYAKDSHQEGQNIKCPYNDPDRLFREEGQTKDDCKALCDADVACKFYSWGTSLSTHPDVCMGCQEGVWDVHEGFSGYRKESVDYSAFTEESEFTLELNDIAVADVQANLPMYRNGIAASLNVSPDRVSIVVSTAARRRLTGGAVLTITVVSLTANDATNVQIAAQAPAFVATVATELSVSASAIAVDATTCSVACTFATVINVNHDTSSAHTHHRCYVDHSDSACKCTCCNSATSDCSSAVNFLA
jgi:hypothetical protein